jgi:hypothetical protein
MGREGVGTHSGGWDAHTVLTRTVCGKETITDGERVGEQWRVRRWGRGGGE